MFGEAIVFWIIGGLTVLSSLGVLLNRNPIYSALLLAVTMIGFSGLFLQLNAPFIAGVQLIVYAGAVMVLFVMVLMLFDLRKETQALSGGALLNAIKWIMSGALVGMISFSIYFSADMILAINANSEQAIPADTTASTKQLAKLLYTDYIVAFEVLGVLLLVIAIGAVALSRIKGGTHAKS